MEFDHAVESNQREGQEEEDIFEDLTNIESRFFAEGYSAGHSHGQLHGLFEGRELGREKAFEIWEEIGYYEGYTTFHASMLEGKGVKEGGRGKESRALNHAKILLSLISTFPTNNPSTTTTTTTTTANAAKPNQEEDGQSENLAQTEGQVQPPATPDADIDLTALISSIRARYRLLCSSLGAKPRLVASATQADQVQEDGEGIVQGIEGPMRGVDTRQLRF